MSLITCIGCGGQFPDVEGPTHRYMESSPGCWACFGEVLAREYSDLQYREVHRLTVDAYAIQHPGQPSLQCIRSIALHGISLCAIFENGVEMNQATEIIQRATRYKERFVWLTPPSSMGDLTIAEIHPAKDKTEHVRLVWEWGQSAWSAWSDHHPRFREWLQQSLTV